jgi:ERCC4-type nuclease
MLYSAMFSIQFYKGFSVVRSQSMEESATILCNMAYKMVKETKKQMYYNKKIVTNNNPLDCNELTNNNEENNTIVNSDYVSVIKKVKKDNITKENIGEIMLCNIPGVSAITSITIMKKYKTLPNLIAYIQEDENCLNNITTIDVNGKERKISKTSIKNIVDYLKD